MSDNTTIIKRIKKGGGAGHSSAWKVAYADFVTAMMAFFLLMWLLSTATKEQLQGISKYFTPDFGFSGGRSATKTARPPSSGSENGEIEQSAGKKENEQDIKNAPAKKEEDAYLLELKGEIENFVAQVYMNSNISVRSMPDGIAIEVADHQKSNFLFGKNQFQISDSAKKPLHDLVELLKYVPRYISIQGFASADETDPWLLSVRRSEAMRLYFHDSGIADRVAKISGVGSFDLVDKTFPNSPRNRRVVITLLKDSVMPFGNSKN